MFGAGFSAGSSAFSAFSGRGASSPPSACSWPAGAAPCVSDGLPGAFSPVRPGALTTPASPQAATLYFCGGVPLGPVSAGPARPASSDAGSSGSLKRESSWLAAYSSGAAESRAAPAAGPGSCFSGTACVAGASGWVLSIRTKRSSSSGSSGMRNNSSEFPWTAKKALRRAESSGVQR